MGRSERTPFWVKVFRFKTGKYAVFLWLLSPTALKAQQQIVPVNGFWLCQYSTIDLTNRLSMLTELELHTKEWAQRWSEQLLAAGLSKKIGDKWRFAGGMTWSRTPQYGDAFFFKNEWRPWQEANYTVRGKVILGQRLRNEERWLQQVSNGKKIDSYDYITRLRYRIDLLWPLGKGKIAPSIGNEAMAKLGHSNSNYFLDQNRTWVGVNFKVSRTIGVQTQYMKIFQWRPNNILEDQNIFRVNIVQHFNQKS